MKSRVVAAIALLFSTLASVFAHDPAGWQSVLIPRYAQRTVNDVQVIDQNTIIVVGGNETNDSIRSVFISSDKGQSWSVIIDTPGRSWLTSVHFLNTQVGFAVGYDGAVLKSTTGGFSWVQQQVPAGVAHRDFNSVFFINDQIGFIAGGSRSNDSIQTILKTTDGGNTWNIQRDALGYWLKSIYFTDANNGYAVGEQGVALKTTDGGNSWTQLSLPGNTVQRNFNTVFFIDSTTGFIGGGNETNDSIQTIIRTTDAGNGWSIISDNLSPWIRSIFFPNSATGFAVGNDGTILLSEDEGLSWNQVAIPDTINDDFRGLNAVHFLNSDYGVTSGQIGKTLLYEAPVPTSPTVVTGVVTEIAANTAMLNGTVNGNGTSTTIVFEYGTSITLGNTIAAVPGTVGTNTVTAVNVQLSGLDSNTLYYYRVSANNSFGSSNGVIRQFFTGRNPIPNWDFERWQPRIETVPDPWISLGGNQRVVSYDGSWAADLRANSRTEVGALLYGIPGDGGSIPGGVPFAARPDSLVGYFKYDIVPGDSAAILLWFKKNTVFNSQQFFYISGSSGGNFNRLSFPITYLDAQVPDSVVIGFVNSNPFGSNAPDSNSRLTVDNISFSGTTVNVPNADFENWVTKTGEEVTGWATSDHDSPVGLYTPTVTKTTDSQHGNYAARLQNSFDSDGTTGRLETGADRNSDIPTFAVYGRHQVLNIYLKYFPENGDSATITAEMFQNGQSAGTGTLFIDTTVSSFTLFSIPIAYQNPNSVPDSATIRIESGRNRSGLPPIGASVLYADNLGFDGFYKSEFLVNAGNDVTICKDDSATIGGTPVASGGQLPYTYSWTPSTNLSSTSTGNPSAFPDSTTTYQVIVTDANGVSDTGSVTVVVEICTGIDVMAPENESIHLFPNPAEGTVNVHFLNANGSPAIITLFDISGKPVQKNNAACLSKNCTVSLDISEVESGFYVVAIFQDYANKFKKLIIH